MPDMTPGVPSALSPLVRRIVAPNPGPFTGPGTNTYLVGIDEVAVIDPGPDDAGHIDAIVGASMRERVRWVLLTHTHPDHAPGTKRLVKETGAEVLAFTKQPKDGDVIARPRHRRTATTIEGTEFGLEVLHTPGHAPNHLCFSSRRSACCSPATPSSTACSRSSTRAAAATWRCTSRRSSGSKKLRLARIAPGHGDVIDEPKARIDEYLEHRRARERADPQGC